MLRNPFEGFLVKLLWYLSKGLPEYLRVREIKEVARVREKIRRLAKEDAMFDFIILEVLSVLDDAEGRFYVARPDMR